MRRYDEKQVRAWAEAAAREWLSRHGQANAGRICREVGRLLREEKARRKEGAK